MKRVIPIIVSGMSVCSVLQAQSVIVHTHEQMNGGVTERNTHIGAEAYSSLEPIHSYDTLYPVSWWLPKDLPAEQSKPFYPRVKKLRDGRGFMLWQGGRTSSRIYYSHSNNMRNWKARKRLYGPEQKTIAGRKTWIRYMTADAVVLKTGELVVVASYRSDSYDEGIGCGIVVRHSRVGGDTWGKPITIYEGPNWEPYLLELPDGTLQCYFTDAKPQTRNSGTSMIESYDGGFTWTKKKRVVRQFKYYSQQEKIFTDQMPCFRLLPDGKTVFGLLEARLEPDGPGTRSSYAMSAIWNSPYEWKPLGINDEGPAERETNVFTGNGGYVSVFPSGEVVISAGIGGFMSVKVGDATAKKFNGRKWGTDWLNPFRKPGMWSSTEVVDPHHIVWTMDNRDGILYGMGYLNHRIDASLQTVTMDGDGIEWTAADALFIGSDSPVETVFRSSYDDGNIYVLAEISNCAEGEEPHVTIALHNPSAKKPGKGSSVRVKISADGLVASDDFGKAKSIDGVAVNCRRGKTLDGKKGYVAEVCIPRSALGSGDEFCFYASVATASSEDIFTGSNISKPETWQRIRLK